MQSVFLRGGDAKRLYETKEGRTLQTEKGSLLAFLSFQSVLSSDQREPIDEELCISWRCC